MTWFKEMPWPIKLSIEPLEQTALPENPDFINDRFTMGDHILCYEQRYYLSHSRH
jgi:hypothetical protein